MDDEARWKKNREALGFSKKGEAQALRSFREMSELVFGDLKVVSYEKLYVRHDGKGAEPMWLCSCACGGNVVARASALRAEDLKNCGKCGLLVQRNWGEQLLRRLALSLEFKGTMGIYEKGTGSATAKISIAVRDYARELLDVTCGELGVGSVTIAKYEDRGFMAQWQLAGGEAVALAKAVAPYMVCKKEQAEMVANYDPGSRGVKVAPDVRAERMRLCLRTKELNKKGPRDVSPEWASLKEKWVVWIATASVQERMNLLAWSIEWEGFIGVYERASTESARGVSHGIQIGIPQSVHRTCLLEIMLELAGGIGHLGAVRASSKLGHSAMRNWTVQGIGGGKKLAHELIPFLKCKKRLAETVVEFPEWDNAPLPMPDEIFQKRHALAMESKRINAKLEIELPEVNE